MRTIIIALLLILITKGAAPFLNGDYEEYKDCMRSNRSFPCQSNCNNDNCTPTGCNNCECNSCQECSHDNSFCSSCCTSCCHTFKSCTQTCNSCKSHRCRSSCKQKCVEKEEKETKSIVDVINNNPIPSHDTIISVYNYLNTTNKLQIPVDVNVTSFINGSYPEIPSPPAPVIPPSIPVIPPLAPIVPPGCCTVFLPRKCIRQQQSFPFLNCYHPQKIVCGPECLSPIMHTYYDVRCQFPPCNPKPVYVPQPQPPCAYFPSWPFVNCVPPQNLNCQGCYGHFFGEQRINCSPFCYDEGFAFGTYYRKGPFYQPCYMPAPPCYQTGLCPEFYYQHQFGGVFPGGIFPGYGGSFPDGFVYDVDTVEDPVASPEVNETTTTTTTTTTSSPKISLENDTIIPKWWQ